MPEPKEDVKVESSTTEPVTDTETQAAQTEDTVTTPEQGQVQQTIPASNLSAVDGTGVPIDNREAEWKRKHDQLVERMPEYIDQAVQSAVRTITEKKESYSPEQLRMIIHDDSGTYSASNKVWAEMELEKINERKIASLLDQKFQITQKSEQEKRIRAEAESYVVRAFPEMFSRDANGNITGWNQESQMTKLTAQYMQRMGNRPDAIREAARQAFTDLQLANRGQTNRKVELANAEAAALKRQNIGIGGGGNAVITGLEKQVADAYSKFQASGSVKDAQTYNVLRGKLTAMKLKGK